MRQDYFDNQVLYWIVNKSIGPSEISQAESMALGLFCVITDRHQRITEQEQKEKILIKNNDNSSILRIRFRED